MENSSGSQQKSSYSSTSPYWKKCIPNRDRTKLCGNIPGWNSWHSDALRPRMVRISELKSRAYRINNNTWWRTAHESLNGGLSYTPGDWTMGFLWGQASRPQKKSLGWVLTDSNPQKKRSVRSSPPSSIGSIHFPPTLGCIGSIHQLLCSNYHWFSHCRSFHLIPLRMFREFHG